MTIISLIRYLQIGKCRALLRRIFWSIISQFCFVHFKLNAVPSVQITAERFDKRLLFTVPDPMWYIQTIEFKILTLDCISFMVHIYSDIQHVIAMPSANEKFMCTRVNYLCSAQIIIRPCFKYLQCGLHMTWPHSSVTLFLIAFSRPFLCMDPKLSRIFVDHRTHMLTLFWLLAEPLCITVDYWNHECTRFS